MHRSTTRLHKSTISRTPAEARKPMHAVSPITDRATLWRLGHMIDAHAETAPGSTALIVGDQRRRITYADLAPHCFAVVCTRVTWSLCGRATASSSWSRYWARRARALSSRRLIRRCRGPSDVLGWTASEPALS